MPEFSFTRAALDYLARMPLKLRGQVIRKAKSLRGYRGPSMLDITRGSGREGLPFAPSAALLSEARSNGFDWYKPRYVEEMRQSWKANRAAWDLLLGRNHVVCVCYCADRDLCHRGLFAALIVKAGEWSGRRVIDGGEVVLPSRPPSVSKGDDQPAQ